MGTEAVRAFLDANVLFSAAFRLDSQTRELWNLPEVELCVSSYVANEARRNLAEARPDSLPELERLLTCTTLCVDPATDAPADVVLRAKDRPVLAAAIQSGAVVLVTGDRRDFGCYFGRTVAGVRVVRPGDFIRERRGSPRDA